MPGDFEFGRRVRERERERKEIRRDEFFFFVFTLSPTLLADLSRFPELSSHSLLHDV